MITLCLKIHFDAAHRLDLYDGPCHNLHGHTWYMEAEVIGRPKETGMIMDFKDLKRAMESIVPDHQLINDLPAFEDVEPTAENLSIYFFGQLLGLLPEGVKLVRITVWESPNASASCIAHA